ncbi:MAG: repeat-containing protein [Thermoleophilia bacterium]|nr:repeat-containing protein [Thermoleophilia bacterium]
MHAGHDEDDDETYRCYRHPSVETALRCLSCDRPICVDCANHGPVGIKCPECSRVSRAARGVIPAQRIARGVLAGVIVALVLGTILYLVPVPFIGIILAFFAGAATGNVVRRASGGYRDPVLARGAMVAAAVGMLAYPIADALAYGAFGQGLVWSVVGAAAAAYGAFTRAS